MSTESDELRQAAQHLRLAATARRKTMEDMHNEITEHRRMISLHTADMVQHQHHFDELTKEASSLQAEANRDAERKTELQDQARQSESTANEKKAGAQLLRMRISETERQIIAIEGQLSSMRGSAETWESMAADMERDAAAL